MTAGELFKRATFRFGLGTLLVAVTLLALLIGWLRRPELVHLESRTFGDPDYDITVTERKRVGNISTVCVNHKKGFSVGSAMFVAKALCKIAKARHAEYFVMLEEHEAPDGTRLMQVGFTNVKNADIKREFGSQFSKLDDRGEPRRYSSKHDLEDFFAVAPAYEARP
ncbi:MAG TPA: hypothetical protein VHD36_16440 [Pirellulales bacterium]|nr:hypothetical protein [Pirellulales bacterium]